MNKIMKMLVKIVTMMICTLSVACGKELQVKVVGEDGKPVENAEVVVSYIGYGPPTRINGETDQNGVFVSRSEAPKLRIELEVSKAGYYKSLFRHQLGNSLVKDTEGEYKLILRKIVKPVAMYAKKVNMVFPALGEEYGFDFEAGDWVKPHGKGNRADVFFLAEKTFKDMFRYKGTVTARFSGKKDGLLIDPTKILGSVFLSAKKAPLEDVYTQSSQIMRGKFADKNELNTPLHNYVFRARSEVRGKEIVKANYGRILGGMFVAAGSNDPNAIAVRFSYYFNPEVNDTSLEFARRENLFKNLKQMEHVTHP